MIDFKQMQADGNAAGKACREWVDEKECAVIKQVRERAECFTGSQNKPKTKKAYNV